MLVKLLTDKVDAAEIFDYMIREKMVIRDAASFTFLDESFLRFCVLSPEENTKFLTELKKNSGIKLKVGILFKMFRPLILLYIYFCP